jgi:hypothetical protein
MGPPAAMQEHPGHGCARWARGGCSRDETRVDHRHQLSVFANRGQHPSVIHAFDVSRCHAAALPCSTPRS